MKKIIKSAINLGSVWLVASLICDCADTYSWQNRTEPRLFINGVQDQFSLTDSIKVFFKSGNGETARYSFTLTSNSSISKTLYIEKISGGTLTIDGQAVTPGSAIPMDKTKTSVKCQFKPGTNTDAVYDLEFRLKDYGGWVGNPTPVRILAYQNLLPVARFTVTKASGNSYIFDASASYDRDRRSGGGIGTFTYTITGAENRSIRITQPVYTYGLPIRGDYHIALVTGDMDGGDSEPFSQDIIVK